MLFPVQHVDVLAHFNIAVTFGALVAVGGRHTYFHLRNYVSTGDS
jgi:hypothetical protein